MTRLFAVLISAAGCSPRANVVLDLVDDETGQPVVARVEVADGSGTTFIGQEALQVPQDCTAGGLAGWAYDLTRGASVLNSKTGTQQFYADGRAKLALVPGEYRVVVEKGIEYRRLETNLVVTAEVDVELELRLARWIDLPASGWYGADGHLHLTRWTDEDDRYVGRWMRAEDLHVANLLQMGTPGQFSANPQRAFGEDGVYRDGSTLLLSGQEHPRTHVLGHAVILGADEALDLRQTYILYRSFFTQQSGGVCGYAHWGTGPARTGLALDAPAGLVSFIEVLQFDFAHYDVWYELLNLGLRIAPTAGTDYPCGPAGLPGRERFYTQVDGELSRRTWLEGVRRGKTFVTNGPVIELFVDGNPMGSTVELDAPATVRVEASVRFDGGRDDVARLELVRDGVVLETVERADSSEHIELSLDVSFERSGWLAVRAWGEKLHELPLADSELVEAVEGTFWEMNAERNAAWEAGSARVSTAHSAAVFIDVAGQPIVPDSALVEQWLGALTRFEESVIDPSLSDYAELISDRFSQGVQRDHVSANRGALLDAISESRAFFESR